MNKITLKKNLLALDHNEWQATSINDIINNLVDVSDEEKNSLAASLLNTRELLFLNNSFDLTAPITMFGRSRLRSDAEDAALFETVLKDPAIRNYFCTNIDNQFTKQDLKSIFDTYDFLLPSIFDSNIFELVGKNYVLRELMKELLPMIVEEMKEPSYILSSPAYALFIKDQVNFDNAIMKDNKNPLHYDYEDFIFRIIPTMSVFQDRSRTEALQGFYKDNLIHKKQFFQHNIVTLHFLLLFL